MCEPFSARAYGILRRERAHPLEDTTGEGHSTRITSSEECIVFAVGLPATAA